MRSSKENLIVGLSNICNFHHETSNPSPGIHHCVLVAIVEDPSPNYSSSERIQARLSIKERDDILQNIHGVSDMQKEDANFVQRSLLDLNEALSLIPAMDKMAFLKARELDENYVTNTDFLLMFLRAVSFDVTLAAARLTSFFEAKLGLFGPEKLAKEITVHDLDDEDDIRCLESGYAQVLSSRDRAGRIIFCLLPMIRKYRTLKNRGRLPYGKGTEAS